MKYRSVFDIIGPIMIGPSSSHTAGAVRIGKVARNLFGRKPAWADIFFYGSFAETYKGHGTDVAIVGGLLNFDTFDERMKTSLHIAKQEGIRITFHEEEAIPPHPNTAKFASAMKRGARACRHFYWRWKIEIIELNGFELKLSGHHPALLIMHNDRYGAIAGVANVLAKYAINIGHMEVSRKEKGKQALMTIEVDQNIDDAIVEQLKRCHILLT